MIEKLFIVAFISFILTALYFEDKSYNNDLKEYYYCIAYDNTQDPPIPPLNDFELNNFERNYPDFTTKYRCEIKLYTRKQFYTMRKANK